MEDKICEGQPDKQAKTRGQCKAKGLKLVMPREY